MAKQVGKVPPQVAQAPIVPCKDSTFLIRRRNRFWEVVDSTGVLVCMTVYKRGAKEVIRRLDHCQCRNKPVTENFLIRNFKDD